jgi:hypothetical protein
MKTIMFATFCSLFASACCDSGVDSGSTTFKDVETSDDGPTTTANEAGNEQCCEEFGYLPNHGMICGASEMPWCVGCDGEAVLCMTHGCAVINALDCCLSDEGETVPCDPEN